MRGKELLYVLAFLLVIITAVGCSQTGTSEDAAPEEVPATEKPQAVTAETVPQLDTEGREQSSTMVLLNAPPTMPNDHGSFWNGELRQESCLVCHATPETGAPQPTADHYYNSEPGGEIFRDSCIQCHATQNDTKPAFNAQ
ncbi:nitrate reductase cytochrome c-type subunit [Bacillus sp. Marseille-P3661]|uniref:nitrate reductase cytochrome c-type subunit n=1 Tax=Bacillus sp. Marseille-P3661 TaxID=1936234 RepID=UPI000C834FFD|nr:nitrate reductase cytochrome c-type subunit [Bacillus sp. Marseille-P3661]